MQLQISFSALLAVLLVTISQVEAAPLKKRGNGIVTLPLRRTQLRASDDHPLVRLQQHVNRGTKRFARMTGRAEPSHEELRSSIQKRLAALDEWDALEKRYNRQGTDTKGVKGLKQVGPPLTGERTTNAAKVATGARIGAKGGSGGGGAASNTTAATIAPNSTEVANSTTQTGNQVANGASNKSAKVSPAASQNATQVATGNGNQRQQTNTSTKAKTKAAKQPAVGSDTAATNPGVSQVKIDALNTGKVTQANTPATGDSLGLDIEANDVGYLATIQMGTPPRDFTLLMDSGSADLWVGAENCQSQAGGGCGTHNFLGPTSSSTFQDTNAPFSVTYGTGQVQGDIINDNIVVAGLSLPAHKFGVATTESVEFSSDNTPFDGVMGLAKSALSEQKTLTPIEALAAGGLVQSPITSYKISRVEDQLNDGEITFGGVDQTKFDPNTVETLANVNQLGFWEASMPAVSVDGTDLQLNGRTAIIDTGTTLIIAPAADALLIHQQIPGAQSDGQGGFVIPCTTTSSVALTFGKTAFAIDPRDLAFAPLDPADPTGDCVSGISSGNIGGDTEWLVGDVFLKNAYFSTNVQTDELSLAKLV